MQQRQPNETNDRTSKGMELHVASQLFISSKGLLYDLHKHQD